MLYRDIMTVIIALHQRLNLVKNVAIQQACTQRNSIDILLHFASNKMLEKTTVTALRQNFQRRNGYISELLSCQLAMEEVPYTNHREYIETASIILASAITYFLELRDPKMAQFQQRLKEVIDCARAAQWEVLQTKLAAPAGEASHSDERLVSWDDIVDVTTTVEPRLHEE